MGGTRIDGFLNGRLQIEQPIDGYRAGADAVMLAAACPARPGETVVELGCGVGTASICLGWRVPGVTLTGLERQPDYAAMADRNAKRNDLPLSVVTGDLSRMPDTLKAASFDHVIANPPYFRDATPAPDALRAEARHEDTPLRAWVDAGLRRLRPGGHLLMIHRPERLNELLAALAGRAGAIAIMPIAAREGREAGRILLSARKEAKGALRLLAPFVMHAASAHSGDREDLSPAASAVLREGAAINLR
ncbi:methyltransferase [Paracoccus sp. TK19116]|uniref:Methyltransferase n=1 Tax=Paracoccus albicereus TaxID=2922394 RepID=A0ABT1MSI2_9RHOB|nr:methyltransferase [Paracoccus albicereus]MCQ0971280.1 methyltransferase [Paracoccus albicereus]